MKKRIYITVDTECHDINNLDRYIWGETKDGERWGLEKILEEGRAIGIPINFFVDIAEADRYGLDFVKGIIDVIQSYNQPVFLHLHPNFISGDESRTYLWEYNEEEQKQILARAHQIWDELFPDTKCVAFRAGRYGTDSKIYSLLRDEFGEGLIDLSYSTPGGKMCHLTKNEVGKDNIPFKYNDIILIPNTSYISLKLLGKRFNLGIDASQTRLKEFKDIIKRNSLNTTILTMHSWNFIKIWFFRKGRIGKDYSALKRFRSMVSYAHKEGYIISDLRDFQYYECENDQLIDLCSTPKQRLFSVIYNFLRFQQIARLTPKYFVIYSVFYTFVLLILVLLFISLF